MASVQQGSAKMAGECPAHPAQRWGGDDPEESPGGSGGGAGQGDGGGQPPPPRGDGYQPRGQHRQAGIIDGDATGAAIVDVLSVLAKRL